VQEVRERLQAEAYDLVLMDLNYARDTTSGHEGLDLLTEIHARDRLLPVIVMTGCGSIDTAVEAMRRGARTFVNKPWDNAMLTETVRREIADGRAQREAEATASGEQADAQAIQRALLPTNLSRVPGCELSARWQPALAFGGDCYDAIRLSESRLAVSIADVCGKGLPAALLMSNLQASVRAFSSEDRTPRDVVSSANRALCRHRDLRRFVTLFYAVYDAGTRMLRYTNAGHNPPFVVCRDGSFVRLTTGGMVTGIFSDVSYEEGEVVLEAGDRVILFTDGITEARSAAGAEFGDEGLLHAVMSRRHRDAATLVQGIFEDVTAFTGAALEDDATALVAAVTGRSPAVAPPNGPVPEADRHPAVPASARREPRYLTPARMWHTL
jgi:sigma-B regulation protein RsbU (phosphoserine phosphatase)